MQLVANALNKGDTARAMITAVLMRLPDPGGATRIADMDGVLTKAGFNPDEPRDERGRWTDGGANGEAAIGNYGYGDVAATDMRNPTAATNAGRRPAGVQLADAGLSDASDDPVAQSAAHAMTTA